MIGVCHSAQSRGSKCQTRLPQSASLLLVGGRRFGLYFWLSLCSFSSLFITHVAMGRLSLLVCKMGQQFLSGGSGKVMDEHDQTTSCKETRWTGGSPEEQGVWRGVNGTPLAAFPMVVTLKEEKAMGKDSLGDRAGWEAHTSVNSTLAGSPRMEPSGCL